MLRSRSGVARFSKKTKSWTIEVIQQTLQRLALLLQLEWQFQRYPRNLLPISSSIITMAAASFCTNTVQGQMIIEQASFSERGGGIWNSWCDDIVISSNLTKDELWSTQRQVIWLKSPHITLPEGEEMNTSTNILFLFCRHESTRSRWVRRHLEQASVHVLMGLVSVPLASLSEEQENECL
jgi:hypothetical protein